MSVRKASFRGAGTQSGQQSGHSCGGNSGGEGTGQDPWGPAGRR